MPGTPHHALGSPWLTGAVATLLAAAATAAPIALRSRSELRPFVVGGALAYATVFVSLWALVPAVFWRFATDPTEWGPFAVGVIAAGFVVFALQAAVAVYLYVGWRLKLPLGCLFVVSWIAAALFFRVGGESGPLFSLLLWTVTLGPAAVLGTLLLGGLEVGARRLSDRFATAK